MVQTFEVAARRHARLANVPPAEVEEAAAAAEAAAEAAVGLVAETAATAEKAMPAVIVIGGECGLSLDGC